MLQKMDFNYGSQVDVNISPELNRQRELAIHGIAVIMAHNILKNAESVDQRFTLPFIVSYDDYLKRETNRCLAKMICCFGLQSVNALLDIAVSFEPNKDEAFIAKIKQLAALEETKLLVAILGEDKYNELFSKRNSREV